MEKMKQSTKHHKRQLKRSSQIAILSILLIMIVGIAGVVIYQKTQGKPQLKQEKFTFSIGSSIPYDSASYLSYGSNYEDVTFDPEQFEMVEVGTYEVEVEFADQKFVLPIEIIDDIAPAITFTQAKEVTLLRMNDSLILDDLFHIEDDSEYTYEMTPKETELKNGAQTICVVATDVYGNKSEACQDFTLTIAQLEQTFANVPQADSIEDLLTQYMQQRNLNASTFGFFYASPYDGERYVYNGDQVFNAASTIKVPLNMLYYDRFAQGTLSANQTIVLASSDIEEGAGRTTSDYAVGSSIPISYLQEQSIVNSDNTATNCLIKGLGGFSTFRSLLPQYSDASLPSSFYSQNVITMNYMMDVMERLYQNQDHYAGLISLMKQASAGEYLQSSTRQFEIAQKYGLFGGYLHATGIVYTPHPYIVGIYTNGRSDAENIIQELNTWLIAYQLQK